MSFVPNELCTDWEEFSVDTQGWRLEGMAIQQNIDVGDWASCNEASKDTQLSPIPVPV